MEKKQRNYIKKKKISYMLDIDDLLKIYNMTNRLGDKQCIIDSLFILGFASKANSLLTEIRISNPEVFDDIKWIKLFLKDAIDRKDDYSIKMIVKKLRDDLCVPEVKYMYLLINGIDEIHNFYENSLIPNFHCCMISNIPDLYLSLYYWNKITNKRHTKYAWFEVKLEKRFRLLRKISKYSIYDIAFAENSLKAFLLHQYSKNELIDIRSEIDHAILSLNIVNNSFLFYSDNKRNVISDVYIGVCEYLVILTKNIEYQHLINNFIETNSQFVGIFYKHIYSDTNLSCDFKTTLVSLCQKNDTGNIANLFLYEMTNENWDCITDESLNEKIGDYPACKPVIDSMISFVRFITGELFDPQKAKYFFSLVNLPEIVLLSINYENGIIQDKDFDTAINSLMPFPISYKLFNRILVSVGAKNNIGRMISMLKLLDMKCSDSIKICREILSQILSGDIIVNYFEFEQIIKPLFDLGNFDISHFIILISFKFENYNQVCCSLVNKNMNMIDNESVKIDCENFKLIMLNYLPYIIKCSSIFDVLEVCSGAVCERVILKYAQTRISELLLLSGQIFTENIKNHYFDVIDYLDRQQDTNVEVWDDIIKRIYTIIFVENTINQRNNDYGSDDYIYYKNNMFLALMNEKLQKYYSKIGVKTVNSIICTSNYTKLSLINKYISMKVFENYQFFGLTSISIPQNVTPQDLLRELGKHIHLDEMNEAKERLENGSNETLLFSVFSEIEFIKRVQQIYDEKQRTKLFSGIRNDNIFYNIKKILHPSSVVLLAVIDGLKVIEKNEDCVIFESFFTDIVTQYSYPVIDFADGILKERVFIEDTVERLASILVFLKENNRVISLPEGGLFSSDQTDNFHKYDIDTLKMLIHNSESNIAIVSDDKFYFSSDLLKSRSTGVFSLVIESFSKGLISESELLMITQSLHDIQYNNMFGTNIIGVLIGRLDKDKPSNALEKTIDLVAYEESNFE